MELDFTSVYAYIDSLRNKPKTELDTKYNKATAYLEEYAFKNCINHYEIVEDTYDYEYKYGLLFIWYADKEHKEEIDHFCINVMDF